MRSTFPFRLSAAALFTVVVLGAQGCGTTRPNPAPVSSSAATFTLESKVLGETRRLNVYTPPGYEASDRPHPVLYMPDGGLEEDFPHITETVDELIRDGSIAPVLVVGIENTVRRRDLNGPTTDPRDLELAPLAGGSDAFRAFIRTELIPEIERRYRVSDERAIVGESAAGSFVVETFFLAPDLFDRYMAMDPALYWNHRELVKKAADRLDAMTTRDDRPLTLWLTTGTTPEITPATEELAAILEAHAPEHLRWTYDPRPQEGHRTIFRATKADAFRWALWARSGSAPATP